MKDLIEAELAKHPHVGVEFTQGGKHQRVVVSFKGKSRFIPFTNTKTNRRGKLNNIAQIRRELRTLGAIA